jgi:transcriptional regulator with XRE-family HTH domain
MTPDELLRRYPRETLRWLRGRLGVSQLDLALDLGTDVGSVSRWETGRSAIGPTNRRRLAALLAPQLATEAGAAFLTSLGEEE